MNEAFTALKAYGFNSKSLSITPIGNGLINSTYLVHDLSVNENTGNESKYILQKINHQVFQQPDVVSKNADVISAHLTQKVAQGLYPLQYIKQVANLQGKTLTEITTALDSDKATQTAQTAQVTLTAQITAPATATPQKSYWRLLNYIDNSYALETLNNPEQGFTVGQTFGQFSNTVNDININNLSDVIVGFHDLNSRLQQLQSAMQSNKNERSTKSSPLIKAFQQHQEFIDEVKTYAKQLPLKLTHNDTKINNLLFSSTTNSPIAVVDLDTCMPGFLMNDFGDMVRTCCVSHDENHQQLDEINFNQETFTELATGYIGALKNNISNIERQSLVIGCLLQPFMLSIRFLSDYLNGDSYFTTQYSGQNLERAQNQYQLFLKINQQRNDLETIVNIIGSKV